MTINRNKTKELVFHRPNPRLYLPPHPLLDIERVTCIKLLGVYFAETLTFEEHVKYLLTLCNQRLYLLKTFCSQGMFAQHLNAVYHSLIVSRLSYALPTWGGFLTKDLINKIDAFFMKTLKYGYANNLADFNSLLAKTDLTLFNSLHNSSHCLNFLLPPEKTLSVSLRNASYELPRYFYKLFRNSFIVRTLYDRAY